MNFMFTRGERESFYRVLYSRRDVRGNRFKSDPIPSEVLMRILMASHHAPSVGFSQPWDFIIVDDKEIKSKIKQSFERARKKESETFNNERKEKYLKFKLEGITEAPVGICITCDRSRSGPAVIGKSANPQMDIYSCVCAVENLWLAARAENLGVGWVSILNHNDLKKILNIPENIEVVAYLCVGYVREFSQGPELRNAGWLKRLKLKSLIHRNQWRR